MPHPLEIVSAGLFAFLGAGLILLLLSRWTRAPAPAASLAGEAIFLFEGQRLADATPAARRLLRGSDRNGSDLAALARVLAQGFGADLAGRIAGLPAGGRLSLSSAAGRLEAEEHAGVVRVTLRPGEEDGAALDRMSLDAAREELAVLRGIAEDAPHPIWALDEAGALAWANAAYLALSDRVQAADRQGAGGAPLAVWPACGLFDVPDDLAPDAPQRRRASLTLSGLAEPLWFDVTSLWRGAGTLHFAVDVGDLVAAEAARVHFVQSLAKTFAQLPTGLAIFDRQRRLALFNPAFLDLTGLPAEFLSGRPLVHTVLDRLREAKVLPEPRDYANWREALADLESAASQGGYSDNWTLPGGRTLRVTGRPHPDGALAFLFEDISTGLGQARQLRAGLDAARAAFEGLEDASIVFAADGAPTQWNAAYRALWELPAGPEVLGQERERWDLACGGSEASALLDAAAPREGARLAVLAGPAGPLRMRVAPLPHGATLVSFRPLPEPAAIPAREPSPARRSRARAVS